MSTSASSVPGCLRALVDDAAVFPPGDAPLADAVAAHLQHRRAPYADVVGLLVVGDQHLPDLPRLVERVETAPLRTTVVVSGGAGAIAPTVSWATRADGIELAGLEVAVRDSATGEATHNARRIVTALDQVAASGGLGDGLPVYVEMPRLYGSPPTPDWFGALDELAAAERLLKLRTGGVESDAFPAPHELAGCIEAALDREMPFKCTAGLHHAVRHRDERTGFEHHGFLNVLLATTALFDGASVDDAARVLDEHDADALVGQAGEERLTSARRWFTSFGSCSVDDPVRDLRTLGMLGS